MLNNNEFTDALNLCGFPSGDKRESRLLNILSVILKLQMDPPIPLTFSQIYEEIEKEDPSTKLTKAWIHKVLKALIEAQLIRVDNPAAHRKRYIADVNTVMAGLEQIKSQRVQQLETKIQETHDTLEQVSALDCGKLAQEFVRNITGQQQEISSRVVRGVDALHRVLRYNMLDAAKKGDVIRATLLWAGPWIDSTAGERILRFFEAAERDVEVRYLITTEIFRLENEQEKRTNLQAIMGMFQKLIEMRTRGKKFDARFYLGPKTYNQISLNRDSMALIITENPVTATWITKRFNPDLIDNAVKSFDRDWKKSKSVFDLSPQDMAAMGVVPGGVMSKLVNSKSEEKIGNN
jgi:Asp-tRNA(Asn)/Glu-tRNA(Gln) amidotransferase C subunit